MMNNFYETKKLFEDYINYKKSLSYVEWLSLSDDAKAAALFVEFFNQIILAWNKAKSYDGDDEEAVETVIQYLMKNVDRIKEYPSRYSGGYIYRVAYNCLYCICHDRKIDKDRREREVYAIQVGSDGEEFDLLDCFVSTDGTVEAELDRMMFWEIIEDLDADSIAVIERILKCGKLPGRMSEKNQEIVEGLKVKLACVFDITA